MLRITAHLIAAMLLPVLTPLVGGCEERVVGVRNSWTSTPYTTAERERRIVEERQRANRPDPVGDTAKSASQAVGNTAKGAGNLLFGWTKVFEPKPKTIIIQQTPEQPAAPVIRQ